MRKTMRIGRQLMFLAGACMAAMIVAVGALSYLLHDSTSGLRRMSEAADRQNQSLLELVGNVGKVQSTTQKLVREKDPDALEKLIEQSRTLAKEAGEAVRSVGAQGGAGSAYQALESADAGVTAAALRGDYVEAQRMLIEESAPRFEALLESISDLTEIKRAQRREENGKSESRASAVQLIVYLLVLGMALGMAVAALLLVRNVNARLRSAAGNLTEAAGQMASAAAQVSSSSQSLAQGASEQAASLEETSASSEEISSMGRRNSENSHQAAGLASHSQEKFGEANQALDEMVVAMGEINTQSDKISKIIKTIDAIAFQTNILALNAAVEAARAGEAGMGFAVVAEEVRNLAQRCAQAAKDTTSLIEESIAKSNDGKAKVDHVATVIRAITEEAGKIKALMDEVNRGSEEQSRGIEQIAKAIVHMEQVTQQTAATAEESASAAKELDAQSETLKEVVERLTAIVGGRESEDAGHSGAGRKPPAESAARGLAALSAAVVRKPGSRHPEPVAARVKGGKEKFRA